MATMKDLREAADRLTNSKIKVSVVRKVGVNIVLNVEGIKTPIVTICASKKEALTILRGMRIYLRALIRTY